MHEHIPKPFGVWRCIVAAVTGVMGLALGAWLGLYAVGALDKALDYPMGRSGGFLSFGNLTFTCVMLATPLGAVFGALGGHALLSGRGSFWAGFGAMLVGMVPMVLMSLEVRGLVFPALLLLPLATAVGLELSNKFREE